MIKLQILYPRKWEKVRVELDLWDKNHAQDFPNMKPFSIQLHIQ
jgi:hypothetical protein